MQRPRALGLLLVVVLAFQASVARGEPAFGETLPLGELLNPDGGLDVDRGFSGSLDPTGWRMVTGEDGSPRFVPAAPEASAPADVNWDDRFFLSELDGDVFAIAVDGTDVYVGGHFEFAADERVNGVARWDGSSWHALGTGVSGFDPAVFALAVSGGDLYVGGSFDTAGGATAYNVARWDGSSWHALGSGTNDDVYAFAVSGGDVYVGGFFTTAGGVTVGRVARWDGSGWHALGTGVSGGSYFVRALAVTGTDLYVGGSFTTAGGVTADSLAQWDGSSWSELGGGTNGTVYALAVSGSDLFVGGEFTEAGVFHGVSHIARWTGSDWDAVGTGPDLGVSGSVGGYGPTVYALAVSGGDLYVGGPFATAGGIPANGVVRWDGSSWHSLAFGTDGAALAFGVSGTDVYVGGIFSMAGGEPRHNVARWDGSGWNSMLGSGKSPLGMDGPVRAVAVSGGDVYVGGDFTTAGGVAASHIARWDGSGWHALGNGVWGSVGGEDPTVYAIAVIGSDVYVGGRFFVAGEDLASNLARWDGNSWYEVGLGTNNVVRALAVSGGDLYVGGDFTQAGFGAAGRVARWDGSSWHALGSGVSGGSPSVYALAASGSDLYVGGYFASAGAVTASNIALWDGNNWHALGSGTSSTVLALTASGSDLYAGGGFYSAGGKTVYNLARWDGAGWHRVGFGTDDSVYALAVSGGDLYVGGAFVAAGATAVSFIARWDGSSWDALGSGVFAGGRYVNALAASGHDLFAGGDFLDAGSKPSARFARWNDSRDLRVLKSDSADPVDLGDGFAYTVALTNLDAVLDATGVALTDTLPAGVSLVSVTPERGACGAANPIVCDVGTLDAGESLDVTFSVQAMRVGTWSNEASVAGNEVDPVPGNDSTSQSTTVSGPAFPATEDWEDGDLDGWGPSWFSSISVTHETSGGNPDGHIRVESSNPAYAPVASANTGPWVGDYAAGGIVSLSVDAKAISAAGRLWILFAPFDFLGFTPTWSYALADPLPFDGAWHSFEIVFNPTWSDAQAEAAGWVKSPPDSTYGFEDVMSGVAVLAIFGEEDFRVDNVVTSNAGGLRFEASLEIEPVGLLPVAATGSGVALVNGGVGGSHLSSLSLPEERLAMTGERLASSLGATVALVTLSNGPGSLTGGSTTGTLGGVMPLRGTLRLCLVAGCAATVPVPATLNGTRGIGLGGAPIVVTDTGYGLIVTVQGSAWDVGSCTVSTTNGTVSRAGFAHGPLSATDASSLAGISGVVQLVTPVVYESNVGTREVAFGVLTLHFVPEPGRALLLIVGAGLLGVLGWKRAGRH